MPPKGPKEGKGGSVNIQFYTSDLRVVCFQEGKEEGYGTLFSPKGLIVYQGLWSKGNPVDTLPQAEKEKPKD